jgi:hypothetical protein
MKIPLDDDIAQSLEEGRTRIVRDGDTVKMIQKRWNELTGDPEEDFELILSSSLLQGELSEVILTVEDVTAQIKVLRATLKAAQERKAELEVLLKAVESV